MMMTTLWIMTVIVMLLMMMMALMVMLMTVRGACSSSFRLSSSFLPISTLSLVPVMVFSADIAARPYVHLGHESTA